MLGNFYRLLNTRKHTQKIIRKGGPRSVYKLGVPSFLPSANEVNSFIFCGMCLFRSSRYFFHNFRGLRWIPQKKRLAPNFKKTTLAHFRLSLLLTITTWLEALLVNMSKLALMFLGKFHCIKTINVRKKIHSLNEAFDC